MDRDDVEHYQDVSGTANDDADPIGGDLDPLAPIADGAEEVLFTNIPIPPAGDPDGLPRYATAWKKIKTGATGTLTNPFFYNRAGLVPNDAAGPLVIQGLDADDVGTVRAIYKADAGQDPWDTGDVVANGLSAVTGSFTVDAGTLLRAQYLIDGQPAKPKRPITGSIMGQICFVFFGTGTPENEDPGRGNSMCSREFKVAIATDINTNIGWSGTANRVTAPDTNVGSFEYATRWDGGDDSLAVASDMVADDELNYCVEFTPFAGAPRPTGGDGILLWDVDLGGDEG